MEKKLLAIISLAIIGISFFVLHAASVNAAPDTNLTIGKSVIGEGDDFATRVLGLPWDMSTQPYPDFITTLKNVQRSTFTTDGDQWNMSATSNDPVIWLLWPGINNTQKVLKLGDQYPINAGNYKLLSFRMCSNIDDYAVIYWFYGRFIPSGLPPHDISELIRINQGCHVYTINMDYFNGWEGTLLGLRLDPISISAASQLKLDWVRLTTKNLSNIVPISWSEMYANTNRLNFYLNTSCSMDNSFQIGWVDSPNRQGTFNWGGQLQFAEDSGFPYMYLPLPESIEPGNYRVLMIPEGQTSPTCSDKSIEIRKAPILDIQKPSFLSGPDYATEVVGDPWGMANEADFARLDGFSQVTFDEGTFSGTTLNSDPKMFPQVSAPINSQKYKYATFRMRLSGIQDVGRGWVQRFHWWSKGPTIDPETTQDMVIYEGWNTYSIDLSTALMESGGGWTGFPITLRFDPEEVPLDKLVYLDYLILTGDEIIRQGQEFDIYYQVISDNPTTLNFYYDSDTIKTNGRSPIGQVMNQHDQMVQENVQAYIYLPLVTNKIYDLPYEHPPELGLLTGNTYHWDTGGVNPGVYYISVDVSDGYNTTTWYSEIPIYIQDP
jgi:hypothetical protein